MADLVMSEVAARVRGLDHINICTRDLDASVKFYVDTFGLEERDAVGPVTRDQARWLCDADGNPIVHLYHGEPLPAPTGPIQHVALRCYGKVRMLERLKTSGAKHDIYDGIPGLTLVFVQDPHGITVELNFPAE